MKRGLWILVLCAAGCASIGGATPRANDGGLRNASWRDYESMPAKAEQGDADSYQMASWYLDRILVMAGDRVTGATASQLALVNNGVLQRRTRPYAFHDVHRSAQRVRLAYLHALDRNWNECADTLMGPPSTAPVGPWPDVVVNRPVKPVSIGVLLGTDENDSESILGSLKDNGHPPATLQRVRSWILGMPNPPFRFHSAESAWMHAYLAREYARTPTRSLETWKRVEGWVKDELSDG